MIALDKRSPQADPSSAPADGCVVRAVGLGKSLDERVILHDVNLELAPGSFLALLGPNGAGKTTLLHILATLNKPSRGRLELFGQPVGSNMKHFRGRIGMIGHQPMLYRELSALENLVFFGKLYGLPDAKGRALDLLERVHLAHRAGDAARTFSRGMVQRLSIARALMHDPDLLLADEPFAGLDVPSTRTVENLLTQMNAEGRTIILSNHDVPQSLGLAKRVAVLRRGHVVFNEEAERTSVQALTQEVIAP